jgi:hypothetical protein
MAAAAQRRQVRKLIAILGTNKMMDGKLRFHHRRAKLSAIGPISVGEGKSLGKVFGGSRHP